MKQAHQVFNSLVGIPLIPDLFTVFDTGVRQFVIGGWHYHSKSDTPRVYVTAGKMRRYLGGVTSSSYMRPKENAIPEQWIVLNLTTHETWSAREFYAMKRKKKSSTD